MKKLRTNSIWLYAVFMGCAEMPPHDGSLNTVYQVNEQSSVSSKASAPIVPKPHPNVIVDENENKYEEPKIQKVDRSDSLDITALHKSTEILTGETITSPNVEAVVIEPVVLPIKEPTSEYVVESGETLFSIAEKLTGSSNNWKEIAQNNHLDTPESLRVGTIVKIPPELVLQTTEEPISTPSTENVQVSENTIQPSIDTELTDFENEIPFVLANRSPTSEIEDKAPSIETHNATNEDSERATGNNNAPGFTSRAVAFAKTLQEKIFASKVNKRDISTIENAETNVNLAKNKNTTIESAPDSSLNRNILISGSYTPKAIYKGAGYDSGLLMRVPPGTHLKLTKSIDEWFQVETIKGSGYVFHRDAEIIR